MDRRTVGGAAIVIAGGFLGRETVVWVWNKALDFVSASARNGISFAHVSWQNTAALLLVPIGTILVLWPKPKKGPSKSERNQTALYNASVAIIQRVRRHRSAKWFQRDHLEPVSDIARAGISVLLSYRKVGFVIPTLNAEYAEQVCIGLETYFAALIQLIGRGHEDEAMALAPTASEHAELACSRFQPQAWAEDQY